jgi:hypothetical protein
MDASVIPLRVSGNIVSAVYAIAENGADLIKKEWSVCSMPLLIWFLCQGKDCSGGNQPNPAEGSHVYGFGPTCRPLPGVWDSCSEQPESRWDAWGIDSDSMKIWTQKSDQARLNGAYACMEEAGNFVLIFI